MGAMNRRMFLKGALGVAGAAATITISGTKAGGKVIGANDRLRIAVAGLKGRGKSHVGGFSGQPNVQVAYLIDPDANVLNGALSGLTKKVGGGYKVQGVADVRKALEDKDLDAISVATPNHWHSLMTIWGCQAGKHVYVEKPASHDVYEGRVAVEAWKKYGVVVQHGTQQRSSSNRAAQIAAIQSGKFGKLKISYGYCCKPRGGIGQEPYADPPANLDWDLWRGPAKLDKYHANYVHYNWHWFWATGNGDMNNQGTHQLDVARWALAPDQTHPVRAMALGGRFQWDDQGETPNTMFGAAEYPNGQWVFFNVRNVNYKGYKREVMNEFYFEDGGWMDDKGLYYKPGEAKGEKVEFPSVNITPGGNFGSFIAACRAGKPEMANGNMLDAHYGCVLGHLMNNSYRLGEKVPFNEKAGKFGDNKDAAEHFMRLHKVMADGCQIPINEAKYTVGPWLTFDPKTERHTGPHAAEANKLMRDPNRKGFEVPELSAV